MTYHMPCYETIEVVKVPLPSSRQSLEREAPPRCKSPWLRCVGTMSLQGTRVALPTRSSLPIATLGIAGESAKDSIGPLSCANAWFSTIHRAYYPC